MILSTNKPDSLGSVRFDAITTTNFDGLTAFTRPELILDENRLNSEFRRFKSYIGAFPAYKITRLTQLIAERIVNRLARRYSKSLGIDTQTLIEGWFFSIWSELCHLIPARHLARQLANEAAGDLILIKLSPSNGHYLCYWDRNALEPFWLAYSLRRMGASVAFVINQPELLPEVIQHVIRPFPTWNLDPVKKPELNQHKDIVVASGIRGLGNVLSQLNNPLLLQAAFSYGAHEYFNESLQDYASPLPDIVINFVRQPNQTHQQEKPQHYVCELPHTNLATWFQHIMGPRTQSATIAAARIVKNYGISEAHICDHLFFESGIMAGAVRQAGGEVVIWSHATNPLHVKIRSPAPPKLINCFTTAVANHWKQELPSVSVVTNSNAMLLPGMLAQQLDPSMPLTVVLLAGEHWIGRMPFLDIPTHEGSYKQFFLELSKLSAAIRLVCRPRAETMDWLHSLAPPGMLLQETIEHPTEISLPNMIFLSISLRTSALLEGLGRGIPCMIIKEGNVEDFSDIDPAYIPIGSVQSIVGELSRCTYHQYLKMLTERQLAWYRSRIVSI